MIKLPHAQPPFDELCVGGGGADVVVGLGVRRSHFLGIALVAGVRSLMRASALETPLTAKPPAVPEDGEDALLVVAADVHHDEVLAQLASLQMQVAQLQQELSALQPELSPEASS